jgi:hypothetical protein
VLTALIPSQDGKAQSAAATAEYEKMVAAWQAETKANKEAVKKVQATDEYKAAQQAKDNAKVRELIGAVKRPDAKAFGESALKSADQFGNDGLRFLSFAASNFTDKDVLKGIVERVRTKFSKSPALAELLEKPMSMLSAVTPEEATGLLEQIATDNPDGQCKAWSLYWQSVLLGRGKPTDEQKAKAAELVAAAEKLATGDLADRLAAPRFQKENLQIGMTVPEIVGEDIDGVPFKLSDYRGKVVVLDFWGYW